jgi:hypothetical protein
MTHHPHIDNVGDHTNARSTELRKRLAKHDEGREGSDG